MLAPVGPLPPSIYWRRRLAALVVVAVVSALLIWALAALTGGSEPDPTPAAAPASSPPPSSSPDAPAGVPTPAALAAPSPDVGARPAGGGSPTLLRGGLPATALGPTALGPTGRAAVPVPGAPGLAGDDAARAARPVAPAPVPVCPDSAITVRARTDKPRYAAGEKPVLGLVVTNTGAAPCRRDLDAARQAVAVVRHPGDGLWSSNDCADVHTDDVRTLPPGGSAEFTVRWSGRTSTPGCGAERDTVPPGTYQLLARLDGMISEPAPFVLG